MNMEGMTQGFMS